MALRHCPNRQHEFSAVRILENVPVRARVERRPDVLFILVGREHQFSGRRRQTLNLGEQFDAGAAGKREVRQQQVGRQFGNALEQARQFTAAADVTALAITKLDGTAKGGVVLAIANQFKIPVKFIGVGEKMEDLQAFNRIEFVNSLFADH